MITAEKKAELLKRARKNGFIKVSVKYERDVSGGTAKRKLNGEATFIIKKSDKIETVCRALIKKFRAKFGPGCIIWFKQNDVNIEPAVEGVDYELAITSRAKRFKARNPKVKKPQTNYEVVAKRIVKEQA